ncbi:MAG TPA: ribbon-helix-helix domain-containing protein [Bacillota bacterium]|nr:ribbon-helix-helix domain-containing protein [Bacillota bacterium]
MANKIILKNRVQFSSTMEKGLAEKLKSLSTETRIPTSKLLDEAIADLITKYGK